MESLSEIDAEDLHAFLVEGHEILSGFEQDILNLEKGHSDSKLINQLYRALHTIKGNCGFLPFPRLEAIAHAGETLLEKLRTTQDAFTPAVTTALLQLTDAIRQTLLTIEATSTEGDLDYSALITTLADLSVPPAVTTITVAASNALSPNDDPIPTSTEGSDSAADNTLKMADATVLDTTFDATIRVQVNLLDHMMNLVSELVLVRNRLLQLIPATDNPALTATYQQINLITNELQDNVMGARMQPISTLWRNVSRLVRETAIACGKEVVLELDGGETELDRSLIAAIKDPLTHLIRNSIDHGIELPNMRVASGKPAPGTLRLRALQENGKVTLETSDDGAGMDPLQIRTRAQQLGLISPAQAKALGDREALDLIFLPGFSTAREVTRLSGRGFGMDVVRRNLETVNGTIEIESELGRGTTFRLKIPLTLAIIPALIVTAGGERFTLPQTSVQELIRIEGRDQINRSIETLLNVPVYQLRGQLLPLVNLASLLKLAPAAGDGETLYFVVLTVDGYQFGLIVDQIEDTQDIVVKPLSRQLKSLNVFAGATVLGDGKVALILNVMGLAQQSAMQQQPTRTTSPVVEQDDRPFILIVLGPQNTRMGICLTHDTRLEMVPRHHIQQIGEQYVMQYRDRIACLIDLELLFTGTTRSLAELEEAVPIVVMTLSANHTVGLVVHQILDIVAEPLTITGIANRPGVQCYATVQGQITEILDLEAMIDLANPYNPAQALMSGAGR
jgi:two-component system chemotaxis sensor kinase CheA